MGHRSDLQLAADSEHSLHQATTIITLEFWRLIELTYEEFQHHQSWQQIKRVPDEPLQESL